MTSWEPSLVVFNTTSPRLLWNMKSGMVCQLPVPWSHSSLNEAFPDSSVYSMVMGRSPSHSLLVTTWLVPQLYVPWGWVVPTQSSRPEFPTIRVTPSSLVVTRKPTLLDSFVFQPVRLRYPLHRRLQLSPFPGTPGGAPAPQDWSKPYHTPSSAGTPTMFGVPYFSTHSPLKFWPFVSESYW